MIRAVGAVVTAVVAVVLLAGCQGGASTGGAAASSPSPSSTPSATVSTRAGVPAPTPPQPGAGLDPPCTRDNLEIAYQPADNTAGHAHGILQFRNSGATACSMTGFPVLYFGNSEAEQPMGAAAGDDTSTVAAPVDLAPGAAAHAAVTITDASLVGGCTVQSTDYLIAAPPLSHAFDFSSDGRHVPIAATDACSEDSAALLLVGAVVAG